MEGKSNLCNRLGRNCIRRNVELVELHSNEYLFNSYARHAEDPGVEIQGFNRILDSQHRLLHHEILHDIKGMEFFMNLTYNERTN